MKSFTRSLLAASLAVASASTAFAQTTTGTTTTGTTTGATTGTTGIPTNSGMSSSANTGFGGTLGQQAPPTITSGAASGANVNGMNAFAGYYANPFYQGRPGSTGNDNPGGFGVALSGASGGGGGSNITNRSNTSSLSSNRSTSGYGSTGTSATGTSATGRTSTGTTGTGSTGTSIGQGFGSGFGTTGTGMTSNRTGTSAFGSTNSAFGTGTNRNSAFGGQNSMMGGNSQQQAGMVAQQARQVNYNLNVRIPAPQVAPTQMSTDLHATLVRSSALTSARGINVQHDGRVVTLRGSVGSAEEARTAVGIARLTPGVQTVKNELTYPAEPKQ